MTGGAGAGYIDGGCGPDDTVAAPVYERSLDTTSTGLARIYPIRQLEMTYGPNPLVWWMALSYLYLGNLGSTLQYLCRSVVIRSGP